MHKPILILALVGLLAACDRADELDERIAAEPGGRLEVDLDFGEGMRPDPGFLEIHSQDVNTVRILAVASGWGASAVRFRVEAKGPTLRLFGHVEGAFSWMFGGPRIAVRIWVPRDFSLDIRCSAGPVQIDDLQGSIRSRWHTRMPACARVGRTSTIGLKAIGRQA